MNNIDVYREAIDKLEKVVGVFEEELEKPELVHGTFVYNCPTAKHVCMLKGVRIVSGLNALLVLLQAGYVTEMGVLVRTIGDCINDIYFLLENFPEPAPEIEKYLANFFSGSADEVEILQNEKRIYRTKARKIYASRARLLSEHINFPVGQDMVYKVYSAYSGYVHSGYPSIMELYGDEPPHEFHLRGMKGTSRIRDWEEVLVAFIQSAILVFGYMAEKYDKVDLTHEIRKTMNWFAKETIDIGGRQ